MTYDYTDRTRAAAEAAAFRDIEDSCYFSGAEYPWLEGPPRIVAAEDATGRHFSATQSFTCIGTRGGGP